jgi:hypothetical protein
LSSPNDILDPAHDPDDGVQNMGAAGIPGKDVVVDTKETGPRLSADGNLIEHEGKKYVTEAALHEARNKNRELSDTLSRLDPVMPEFEEFLKTRDNRRTAAAARGGAGEADDSAYLEEVAAALGFYNEKNEPDLHKAQAHLNITRRESTRAAERAVKPLAEHSTRDRANVNRERARGARFVDGQPIADEQYLEAALKALPDEYLADPNIANITQVIAAGLEYLDLRKNGEFRRGGSARSTNAGTGRREPMHVERGRGRVDDGENALSDLDIAAARARGKTPEQWAKLAARVNPTRSTGRGDTVAFEDA